MDSLMMFSLRFDWLVFLQREGDSLFSTLFLLSLRSLFFTLHIGARKLSENKPTHPHITYIEIKKKKKKMMMMNRSLPVLSLLSLLTTVVTVVHASSAPRFAAAPRFAMPRFGAGFSFQRRLNHPKQSEAHQQQQHQQHHQLFTRATTTTTTTTTATATPTNTAAHHLHKIRAGSAAAAAGVKTMTATQMKAFK